MKAFFTKIMALGLTFLLINQGFRWFYEAPLREAVEKGTHRKLLKYSDIHVQPDIDMAFLGSSRGYCAFDTRIFNLALGVNSYNMCTGSQTAIESYYILRDILKSQDLKYVVFEVFDASLDYNKDYYQILSNFRFMKDPDIKRDMLIEGFGFEGVLNFLFPLLEYRLYVRQEISWAHLKDIFRSEDRNLLSGDSKVRWIQGYQYNEEICDSIKLSAKANKSRFINLRIDPAQIEALKDMAYLCAREGIELYWVSTPFPPAIREKMGNEYIQFHNQMNSLAHQFNVPFIDYNMLAKTNSLFVNQDFKDQYHMNYRGAEKISEDYAEELQAHFSPIVWGLNHQ